MEHEKYNNPADFFIDVIIRNENHMYGINASEEDVIEMKGINYGIWYKHIVHTCSYIRIITFMSINLMMKFSEFDFLYFR